MRRSLFFSFVFILFIAGCATEEVRRCNKDWQARIPVGAEFPIPQHQIPELEMEAAKGSGEAAFRLAEHYADAEQDIDKAMEWYRIAAENGSYEGVFRFAVELRRKSNDSVTQARARYWYDKSVEMEETLPVEAIPCEDEIRIVATPPRSELQKFAGWFHQDYTLFFTDFHEGARMYLADLPLERKPVLRRELLAHLETHSGASQEEMLKLWWRLGAGAWPPDLDMKKALREFTEMM